MTINEVIKLSCDFVNLSELKEVVGDATVSDADQIKLNKLLKCLNLAYEEICSEFLPILKKEVIVANNGEFYFSELAKPISAVVSLKSVTGENMKYLLSSDHISFDGESAILTYSTIPEQLDFGDEIDTILPERVLAYGTAREYLLMQSLSDEATIFETRFKESLENIVRKKSALKMPAKFWSI